MNLRQLQQSVQDYVLTGRPEVISLIRADTNEIAARRIAVYSEGYSARLLEVLGQDYIGLQTLLGDAVFEALGRRYITATPSRYYNARWVGQDLPTWLASDAEYANDLGVLDMAQLDWAITLAFDAADQLPVGVTEMSQIAPNEWPDLRFEFHPSLQVFALRSNALDIKRAQERNESVPATEALGALKLAAVWRRDYRVFYRALPADEQQALTLAKGGDPFGEICEQLAQYHDEATAATRAATILRTWVYEHWLIACTPRAVA